MPVLRTHALTKSYSGRTVVRGVSLEVSAGEVVGLLGPNGAGKTTTFYMVVGLTSPDSGRVELDGADLTHDPMYMRARKGIAYLPQEPSIFRGLTVEDNILAILETLDIDRATRFRRLRDLLAELGLTHLAKSKAYTLSGGGYWCGGYCGGSWQLVPVWVSVRLLLSLSTTALSFELKKVKVRPWVSRHCCGSSRSTTIARGPLST